MIDPRPLFVPMMMNWETAEMMFDLPFSALPEKVLFFPGGISSVNAELHQKGKQVVSIDSAYALSLYDLEKLQTEILQTCSLDWERANKNLSVEEKRSQEQIISAWQKIADLFMHDYQKAKNEGRYVALANHSALPFKNNEFNLACCAGLLIEDQGAVLNLMMELLRVASEVRIFPHWLAGEKAHNALAAIMLVLQQEDYGVELKNVNYKAHEGAPVMLRVWSKRCVVI